MLRVTAASYEDAQCCPFRNVLDRVADKWTFLILAVLEDGPKRFNEVKRLVGDISQRVLTKCLRDLERDGYIARKVYPVSPPRVEYMLTEFGKSLLKPVKQFMKWSIDAHPQMQEAQKRYDRANRSTSRGNKQSL